MKRHLLLLTFIPGISLCSIHACLSWTSDTNTLQLTCRTESLQFTVSFFDNNGKEVAYCLSPFPFPTCFTSNGNNATVVQNITTNQTIVTVRRTIDESINGVWFCHHGKNIHTANVLINIPIFQVTRTTSIINDLPCSVKLLCCTVIGYGTLLVLIRFILAFIGCIYTCKTSKDFELTLNNKTGECLTSPQCFYKKCPNDIRKLLVYMVSIILVVIVAITIGDFLGSSCNVWYIYFLCFGAVLGVISGIRFSVRKGAATKSGALLHKSQDVELDLHQNP